MSSDSDATLTHAGLPPADPTATVGIGQGAAALPPAAVPGYRLDRELGRGGMGVVYLATQYGLNRSVALKMVLSGEHASATEKGRFLAEAEAVAAVRHPGVVQVFDFGTHDGRPYFALEYLSGGSLSERLNGTPLAASDAAKVVEAVGRAVQAVHDAGVIHRDLKPANILFDAAGLPKVTDFGLARKGDASLTATGAILGTPSYMAPEQAEGRKDVGPAADVYALGAVLYECLTGRPPFRAASALETIHQVLKDEPVPPSRFTPKLPRDLETVALKCLNKDRRKRYATAGAMADDLTRYLNGEPILARPVSAVDRGWRWVKRNPLLAAVVIGGPALLTGTTVVVLVALLMTAAANVKLAAERQNAENQKVEAERQRELAHTRLEKAIEAVDKMLTRVGSERWATNPALQEDRRQVLEDAVAFYTGFAAEDSTDPQVRREAAKAHARVAGVYLMLGDLEKTVTSAREAQRLYAELSAEFPTNGDYPAGASHAFSLSGGASALAAQYSDALTDYTRAVDASDTARQLDPHSAEYTLRAVEARSSLAFFYLQADRVKGEEVAERMLQHARLIGTDPNARYEYRVALAFALAVAATYDQTAAARTAAQTLTAASAKYDEAADLLAGLDGQPAPTGHAWDRFAHTRAMVAVQRAFIACLLATTPDERREGAKQMDAGLKLYDGLLRVNPKAFPYRLQKYHALRSLVAVHQMLRDPVAAAQATADADRLIDAMVKENPNLEWLRATDALRQSNLLVERVRAGDPFAFEAEADKLIAIAQPQARGDVTYNVACAYAIAGGRWPAGAGGRAAKAVELLDRLRQAGYFRVPARVTHLEKDRDLASLGDRDDYKEFLKAVKRPADPPKPK